jgi:hypothetical protein
MSGAETTKSLAPYVAALIDCLPRLRGGVSLLVGGWFGLVPGGSESNAYLVPPK